MALLSSKENDDNNEMANNIQIPPHGSESKKALIIFTRNPELGKVKTRLAKSVGDESALKIYNFLLKHTVEITKDLSLDKFVFYSDAIHKNDIWKEDNYKKKLQAGIDLGERMENSFSEIFDMGYKEVIIIGCDMFDLEKNELDQAFKELRAHDYVIGPAKDGGYYLLGMKKPNNKIFKDKNWGSSSVLEDTLQDLKYMKYLLLEEKNDIDYYSDIKNVEAFQEFLPPYLDNNFL